MTKFTCLLLMLAVCWDVRPAIKAQPPQPVITPQNAAQVRELATITPENIANAATSISAVEDVIFSGWTLAFNLHGTLLAVGGETGEIMVFEVMDTAPFLTLRRVLHGHLGMVYGLAFHPTEPDLVSGGADKLIQIWDLETDDISATARTNSIIYALTYSPDGQTLYCGTSDGAGIVTHNDEDILTCAIPSLSEHVNIYSIAISPDGTLLASGDTVLQNLMDGTTESLRTRHGMTDGLFQSLRIKLTFSADGEILLNSGINQDSYLWQMDDRSNLRVLNPSLQALSPDGRLVAGAGLTMFDVMSGEQLLPSNGTSYGWSRDATFNPDGTLIFTLDVDGTLRVWGVI